VRYENRGKCDRSGSGMLTSLPNALLTAVPFATTALARANPREPEDREGCTNRAYFDLALRSNPCSVDFEHLAMGSSIKPKSRALLAG